MTTHKLVVEYNPDNGFAVPDNKVAEAIDYRLLRWKNNSVCSNHMLVGTASLVDEIRLRVVRGQILPSEVCFMFKSKVINILENGCLSDWPADRKSVV